MCRPGFSLWNEDSIALGQASEAWCANVLELPGKHLPRILRGRLASAEVQIRRRESIVLPYWVHSQYGRSAEPATDWDVLGHSYKYGGLGGTAMSCNCAESDDGIHTSRAAAKPVYHQFGVEVEASYVDTL